VLAAPPETQLQEAQNEIHTSNTDIFLGMDTEVDTTTVDNTNQDNLGMELAVGPHVLDHRDQDDSIHLGMELAAGPQVLDHTNLNAQACQGRPKKKLKPAHFEKILVAAYQEDTSATRKQFIINVRSKDPIMRLPESLSDKQISSWLYRMKNS
jgi:anti-sigma factor ChrR (cupin superfamily)